MWNHVKNLRNLRSREYLPFALMLAVNLGFFILAFVMGRPAEVFGGYMRIIQSRSILVTDYIAVGGIGAALLNVSTVGFLSTLMLLLLGVKPNGPNIMALWMSIGFAFFGKNAFNMMPLTFGVYLFAKYCKTGFSSYYMSALLAATLTPTVSEIAFLGMFSRPVEIAAGVLLGFFVGFIFPAVSADSLKVHSGFNLYNIGFAGGLIATILATLFKSLGIDIAPASCWSGGNNAFFAGMLFSISLFLLVVGIMTGLTKGNSRESMKKNMTDFLRIHEHSGRLVTDFYELCGESVFINMAALCSFSTSLVLVLGAELNGPAMAGILTMTGFGSLGKHLRNVVPVMIGAVLSAYVNKWDPSAPNNIVAILFASGLAPIAGMFGWVWGIIAGFLHVNIAMFIGDLNGYLNLYNNGFAACFVVMFLLPIITIIKRDSYFKKDKYR
jgi:hypothetical protein